jgi:hypothetical protein
MSQVDAFASAVALASALKAEGNNAFSAKDWAAAAAKYTEALAAVECAAAPEPSSSSSPPVTTASNPTAATLDACATADGSRVNVGIVSSSFDSSTASAAATTTTATTATTAAAATTMTDWHELRLTLLSNRAACHLSLGDAPACVADCSAVLKVDPGHAKARFRRAKALDLMGRPRDALADVAILDAAKKKTKGGVAVSTSDTSTTSAASATTTTGKATAATLLGQQLADKLRRQHDTTEHDSTAAALAVIADASHPPSVHRTQCAIIARAIFSSDGGGAWAQRVVSCGGVKTLWDAAARMPNAPEPLRALAAVAEAGNNHAAAVRAGGGDWAALGRQLVDEEVISDDAAAAAFAASADGEAAATESGSSGAAGVTAAAASESSANATPPPPPTTATLPSAGATTTAGTAAAATAAAWRGVSVSRLESALHLWCAAVVPDPAAQEAAMFQVGRYVGR